ncbi:polysaccharide deacetylase family protein [Streptomyces sp. NPDC093094]|uniref:polysaccharide deacetylase family protein n=1 Tax=Streptomyces sp. NPDC093094 TaxID=3366026 RepID=UPI003829D7FE
MRTLGLVAGTLAAAALLTGCSRSAGPAERLGPEAAGRAGERTAHAAGDSRAPQPPYRRWGLVAPLAAAPRPADRPAHPAGRTLPPVVERVPTRDKVVFLTYDDGAERDPRFVDLVRELRLPVSLFLTDSVVGPGYAHFARLRAVGASVQNHTLDHAVLRGLPYAGQRAEICGQRDKLRARFGVRPRLLRPPYGAHDATTLRAAADCQMAAVVRWSVSVAGAGAPARLVPGDIVSLPSGELAAPPLRDRTVAVLRRIQRQGLTVGRLEDYL